MAVIRHRVLACDQCGRMPWNTGTLREGTQCTDFGCSGQFVEHVPASQLRGAVEAITEWMRGDEAEAISNQAIRDEIPPEDALAHAIDQRFGGQ